MGNVALGGLGFSGYYIRHHKNLHFTKMRKKKVDLKSAVSGWWFQIPFIFTPIGPGFHDPI